MNQPIPSLPQLRKAVPFTRDVPFYARTPFHEHPFSNTPLAHARLHHVSLHHVSSCVSSCRSSSAAVSAANRRWSACSLAPTRSTSPSSCSRRRGTARCSAACRRSKLACSSWCAARASTHSASDALNEVARACTINTLIRCFWCELLDIKKIDKMKAAFKH